MSRLPSRGRLKAVAVVCVRLLNSPSTRKDAFLIQSPGFTMKTCCVSALVRFWLFPSLLLVSASAATLFWDGSASTANSQSDNATTATQNWLSGGRWDDGSASAPLASWTAGDAAIFGGTATSQTITAGFLTVGNLTFGQGPLGTGTSGTAYTISGGLLMLSNSTITANTNSTISSVLAGASGLLKSGAGTLTLATNGTFTGGTTISKGTLQINAGTTTGYGAGTGPITLGDANTGAGEARLAQQGATAWNDSGPGPNLWCKNNLIVAAGPTGRLVILRPASGKFAGMFTGTITLQNNVIFRNEGSDRLAIEGKITGVGNVTLEAPSGRINWDNSANDFIGTVTVTSGTQLQINNNNVIPATTDVMLNGRLSFNSDVATALTLSALSGDGAIDIPWGSGNPTVTVGTNDHSGSFSGLIQSRIALTKTGAGTQTLAGACTHTGTTTVAAGTLLVTGSIANSPVTVAASGTLGGTGTLVRATTVNGFLAPGVGGIGTLVINNAVTLSPSATARMEIKSTGGVRSADRVQGITAVTYGGTLTVTRDPSSSDFAVGDQFFLFSASTYAGSFGAINLPTLTDGLIWDTSRLKTDGSIAVATPNITGPPTFNPPRGSYLGAQSLTLTAAAGATIYYTIDGSLPTASSPHGLSPVGGISIPPDSSMTIKAFARLAGYTDSPVASADYITLTTPQWITNGGGSWLVSTNWRSGVIAGGSGVTADFSATNLTADALVSLDGAKTIGNLLFGDMVPTHNWTLGAVPSFDVLTLDTATGTPQIHVANQTVTLGASLAGTKGLLKTGAGTLILASNGTYGGGTTISSGTLQINAGTGTGYGAGTGPITLGDANTGADGARLAQQGATAWNDYGSGANQWCQNDITVAAGPTGRLVILRPPSGTWAGIFRGTITLHNDVVLRNEGSDRLAFDGRITGVGNVTLEAVSSRITWAASGNDFIGNVTISAGAQMQLATDNAIPASADVTVNGQMSFRSDLATSLTISALNGNGSVDVPWAGGNPVLTVGANGHSGSFGGAIQSRIALIKTGTGTQILAGTCSHTGGTNVAAGTLLVNGSVASSPVTVATGATLGGTGSVGGSVLVNGTLAPGDGGVGMLTVNNEVTLAATSTTQMEISKSGGTATFDRLFGVTTLTQGGTLTVTATGEELQVGDSFRLFTATTFTGAFASVNLPTSYVWDTSQLKTNGTIAVTTINHPPSFAGYVVATPYQKSVTILVRKLLAKASDPDGDTLAATATGPTSANGGTAVVQGAGILYTPANNFSGADTFPVTITDARGATVVGTVTVTVGSGPSGGGLGANPPVLTPLPDGKMGLAFQGIPGRSYIVQRSASGLDNWVTLATIPADASGKVAYTDESPPAGSAFYRLGLP